MLTISEEVFEEFRTDAWSRLRDRIASHWRDDLAALDARSSAEVRDEIFAEIERLWRTDPELGERDLVMFADLKLAERANRTRGEAA